MFCDKCGKELGKNKKIKFCPQCGAEIADAENEMVDVVPVVIKKTKKGILKKIIVLCATLSFIIAFGVAWIHDSQFEAILKKSDNIVILDQAYSIEALYPDKDLMVVSQGGGQGVLKYDWTEIVPCEYSGIRIQEDVNRILALTRVTSDIGGTGGEAAIDISAETGNYVLFDMDGNKLNMFNGLEEIADFQDGRAIITRNEMKGAIDENGNEIIPCKYERLDNFINGLAGSRLDGHINYLDKNGNIQLKGGGSTPWNILGDCLGEQYIEVGIHGGDIFADAKKYGVATREDFENGKAIIPVEYEVDGGTLGDDGIEWTGQAFLITTYNNPTGEAGKWEKQVISTSGETIIPVGYDTIISIGEGTGYICIKNTETKSEIAIYSAVGEKKGEYEGKEVRCNRYDDFIRISIKENEDLSTIIVLDIYGDIINRWENVKHHDFRDSGLYRIDVDNKIEVGDVLSNSRPLAFSETDLVKLCIDGIFVNKWDGETRTSTYELLYRKDNNWDSLLTTTYAADKGQAINVSGESIRAFTVRDTSQWLPFSSPKMYFIGVTD